METPCFASYQKFILDRYIPLRNYCKVMFSDGYEMNLKRDKCRRYNSRHVYFEGKFMETLKKDNRQIIHDFILRRKRQVIAIWVALSLVLFFAVIYKFPAIFGEFSRNAIFGAQVMVIAAFIGFSSVNWKCPSCNKHIGNDISISKCGKCGVRFK